MSVPKQHRAAVVSQANGPLEIKTIDTPATKPDEVLIKVSASSVCYSDSMAVKNMMGTPFPHVPGHEVVGRVVQLGSAIDAKNWKQGELVGVGWNGGYCGQCDPCRSGDFIWCKTHRVTGINQAGGHQEYLNVHHTALVRLPQQSGFKDAELAPLMCAGITVFDALKSSNIKPGDVCVVSGLGGLGHLAVQYANKMGARVVAVSGGRDKEQLAKKLGAHHYFAASDDVVGEVKKLGGAKAVIATAPSTKAINDTVPLLGPRGKLVIVGVPHDGEPISFATLPLVVQHQSVSGLTCGSACNNEATVNFSTLAGIKPLIHEYPLEKANEAYQDTVNGKPKFRNVIVFN